MQTILANELGWRCGRDTLTVLSPLVTLLGLIHVGFRSSTLLWLSSLSILLLYYSGNDNPYMTQ